MKTFTLIVVFFFTRLCVAGQSVTVMDSSGSPISHATVEVPRKGLAGYANAGGVFDLTGWKLAPKYSILFSAMGHREVYAKFGALGNGVKLALRPKELPEVLVAKR